MSNYNGDIPIKSTFPVALSTISGAQVATDAYGPDSLTGPSTKFRTTSTLPTTADQKVFAICKGNVLIVPNAGDPSLVNLVLKPYKQPSSRLPIRYFIYRGLKKSSILDAAGSPERLIQDHSPWTESTMLSKLWSKFKAFNNYTANPTTEVFEAQWVGYRPGDTATNLLDSYFYKVSPDDLSDDTTAPETLFELPMVEEGEWIADTSTSLGLDVVLDMGEIPKNESGFAFDLAYAQAAQWTFDTANLASLTGILERGYRESITMFIDPAAFWGLHNSSNGTVTETDGASTPVTTDYSGNDVYTNVVSLFQTKNRVYVAIDSDRGRSYNYYGQYNESDTSTNCLKVSIDGGNTWGGQGFGTNDSNGHGWPIHIDETQRSTIGLTNEAWIQFSTDNSEGTVLYIVNGDFIDSTNSFLTADNLLNGEDYTESVKLHWRAIEDTVLSKNLNIASIIRCAYVGRLKVVPEFSSGTSSGIEHVLGSVDDIFQILPQDSLSHAALMPISAKSLRRIRLFNDSTEENGLRHFALQTCVWMDYINHLEDPENNTPISRILWETKTSAIYSADSLIERNAGTQLESARDIIYEFDIEKNNYYALRSPFRVLSKKMTVYPNRFNVLSLNIESDEVLSKLCLGITSAEKAVLEAVIQSNSLVNPAVFFDSVSLGLSLSKEGYSYRTFHLAVLGDNSSGDTMVYRTTPTVTVFTLDNYFYFSKGYAEHQESIEIDNLKEFEEVEMNLID